MRSRLQQGSWSRDAAIALALIALAVAFAVAADGTHSAAPSSSGNALPTGWHEIRRPITGVLYPRQVLAAATYPIVFRHDPASCWPRAALRQMPANGVLLQIVEYAPADGAGKRVRAPRLPRRPRRFSYADATYARYECAGPSYKFDYRQDGLALQAQVWMQRGAVAPEARAGALRILNRFDPRG